MKRLDRLERLQKAAATTRTNDEAYQRREEEDNARLEAAWTIMCQTMSEEHARLVVDAYAAGMQDVRHPD